MPTRQSNFTKIIPDAKGYYRMKYEIEPRGSKLEFLVPMRLSTRENSAAANKKGESSNEKDLDKMNREG